VENRHAELGSRQYCGPARRRTRSYRSIVSDLVALIGHVQASLQLIETAIAQEKALGDHDASAGFTVLDDVTPRYAKASEALKACDAGLGAALDLALDSEAAARCLN
jgi:hypothetical protein